MGRKLHFSFTKITVDELYLWLKKKLSKGYFPKFQDFSDEEVLKLALVCHPYISEKLDILCEVVSRDGLKLTWNKNITGKLNSQDTKIDVEFSINGKPSFLWQLMKGHFSMIDLTSKEMSSWKNSVSNLLLRNI